MIVVQERSYSPRRLPVQLRLTDSDQSVSCTTYEIADDSLFIQGAPVIASGRTVELVFTGKDRERISVHCVVEPHSGSRLLLSYRNLDPAKYKRLQEAIWPEWDGRDLLDGLLRLCGRYNNESLADWIRLTTLLCVMQNRRCRFGRPSRRAESTP